MPNPQLATLRHAIAQGLTRSEAQALARLEVFRPAQDVRSQITAAAADLIEQIRCERTPSMMEAMLAEYGLSTDEGVALMCLAEAMLRVPDTLTVNALIEDKIAALDWAGHKGQSASSFINASTWGLMLTGKILDVRDDAGMVGLLRAMVKRLSEPVIRTAIGEVLKKLGAQFVLGQTIADALKSAQRLEQQGYTYSYDMLGEGAKTEADALRYFQSYRDTIQTLAPLCTDAHVANNPGISVKLSALYPRYEYAQRAQVMQVLVARMLELARLAATANMGFNIDAEEVERLDVSLDVIEAVLSDAALAGWDGFGVVVQAYGKRAPDVIDWLNALAEQHERRIMVRLVKGAYWDAEIKRAQVLGLADFAVYTHKAHTDVAYLSCAQKLIGMGARIYPQFATHNAHTMSAILAWTAGAPQPIAFEFQRLHGMGESLHDVVLRRHHTRCRIYAPVGSHRDLLAYLVRRLLENGANGSFVNQMSDASIPAAQVAADPWENLNLDLNLSPNSNATRSSIAAPADLFAPTRINSRGWDVTCPLTLGALTTAQQTMQWPIEHHAQTSAAAYHGRICNPANPNHVIGSVSAASADDISDAIGRAVAAQPSWAQLGVQARAACLNRVADLMEAHAPRLFALLTAEAGKTLPDAVAELREAVDFCRFYAVEAAHYADARARGVLTCISPWNFPLAIFAGQIAAALVTGNAVLAKPAEQTPLIAHEWVALMHQAGVPADVLQLLCGTGATVGAALTADARVAGVCFTGSGVTAKRIAQSMAAHLAPDAMLIAETGGLNAMIVDSSALPEQVVRDVMASSFQSAGQRCSALRILYVQEDIAPQVIEMIGGAMDLLNIGNPAQLSTDVGPVIDAAAHAALNRYIQDCAPRVIKQLTAPAHGYFVPPTMVRVAGIAALGKEMFGPILHVATFKANELNQVVRDINAAGYGLTLGVHSRIASRVAQVCSTAHMGNIYVNRNQIGAIVGSQPFGGHGLSGTGPKAGGGLYLSKFVHGASARVHNKDDDVEKHSRIAVIEAALPDALRADWQQVLAHAGALNFSTQHLPSPTGETNEYCVISRGTVACLGGADGALAQQVLSALLCGNRVQIVGASPDWASHFSGMGQITCQPEFAPALVDAVAVFGDMPLQKQVQQLLAHSDGKIIPLMTQLGDWACLVHERHVCTDTTAAGGNADLLANSD